MGLILTIIVIALVIAGLVYIISGEGDCAIAGFIISCFIGGLVPLLAFVISYFTYVDIRTSYDATIDQYREAVTVYEDRAQIDVKKAALTDFKYSGYQENVADFVSDLRREVVSYNKMLISKRILDKNWFFGALIIAPDEDMKVLNLSE